MTTADSPWLADVARAGFVPTSNTDLIQDGLRCEVAVIGGGIAGLHAALRAAELGREVVLLEANYCGYGASGRNAGHLTPTIGKDLPSLGVMYALDKARALVAVAEAAVAFTEQTLRDREIDANYEAVGNVLAAVHPRQQAAVERIRDWSQKLGARVELITPAARAGAGLPDCVHSGVLESIGGVLHPARYVDGLRRACLAAGVRIVEHLGARSLARHARDHVELVHDRGSLRAEWVVVANNAFAPQLGILRSRVVPLFVQLFRTAPLSPAQLDALGWRSRAGIYTAHELLEGYRLSADDRIIGGAKMVRYGLGGQVFVDADPSWGARLEAVFRQRFPALEDVAITDHWGGPIAMTLDFLPAVGVLPDHPRIGHALAFAGHGLALAGYAGRQIVDELLGEGVEDRALLDHRTWWMPPEPLRYVTARGLIGLFGMLDARLDRRIARERR